MDVLDHLHVSVLKDRRLCLSFGLAVSLRGHSAGSYINMAGTEGFFRGS